MKMRKLGSGSGFTMVELVIALFIVSLAIVGYIGANVAIQRHAEDLHERTVAVQDANRVIEQMRNAADTGTFPANVTAVFPNDGTVEGFENLTEEQVTVSYANTTANPLDVTVTVTWESYTGRQSTTAIQTYLTQR